MKVPSGLRIDSPSWPLLQAQISYWGITDANGNALGTTLVCGNLANEPNYDGLILKILSGPSAGQARTIEVHAGNTLTVGVAFTNAAGAVQQQLAGTLFVILSGLAGGGGPGPAPPEGLFYYGVVDVVPGANQFTIGSLAGLGAGKFDGATNPYFAFVLRDAGGAAAAPQGEQQPIIAYDTATGVFTTTAFTAAVGVGDEILIVSPYLAAMGMLYGERSGALAYLGQCPVGMAASNNTIVCPNLGYFPNDTFNNSYQMIVIRNANAPGVAPEMEMRRITDFVTGSGTFTTEAFSANVEENDIVLIIHNSVAAQISTFGIADAGSGVGAVVDAARTEADDWWNGQTIMMLSGAARGQKRPIADFDAATDTITPAPNFDAAVAAGDLYVILAHYNPIVPRTADDVANYLTSEVVGRKDDTGITASTNTASIMRYLKGIMDSLLGYQGATSLADKLTAARAAFLDAAISSRAVPGDAMALTAAERLIVQALILSDATPFAGALIDVAISSREASGAAAAALAANTYKRQAGVTQIFSKQITSAANAGDVTVATITTQPCFIKRIVLRSNGATTADLTNAAIYGGAGKVLTFIDSVTGVRANIAAADQQVAWVGAATFAATKTIVITLTGTGATAVDLQVDIEYCSIVDGGYLA